MDESIDYGANITWPAEDEEDTDTKGVKLFRVSKKSEEFLRGCFTQSVPNATRRSIRDKYGAPNTNTTWCPTLDKLVKNRLPQAAKSRDKTLAKQQALVLDAVGPLTAVMEDAINGQLTTRKTIEAIQTALRFIGNASMNINRERRRNVIKELNTNLEDMAEDDAIFTDSAPLLLGEGFAKKAKERDEELKCLSQASKRSNGPKQQFFSRGPLLQLHLTEEWPKLWENQPIRQGRVQQPSEPQVHAIQQQRSEQWECTMERPTTYEEIAPPLSKTLIDIPIPPPPLFLTF